MANPLDRMRDSWDGLNDRERTMIGLLGVILAVFVLGFPLFWIATENAEIADENEALRQVIQDLGENAATLKQIAERKRMAAARYKNKTPALGSFLEKQATNHGLTIREVTDQPEKTVGRYHRRNTRASINDVDLTGIMNLMAGIVTSQYPVAIEHIQLEHFQPGDKYRFKFGVLTFDKKAASGTKSGGGEAKDEG
ncbi:MAG: type II secretion system protein GspM [Myxococcales bacterium]|nr:type II secretion system protein GspM [Myxococcales bacterium]